MSESSKSKGPVLRALGGGPIQIVTTRADWETRMVGEGERAGLAVGQSLVAMAAVSYREVTPGSDLWDLVVEEMGPRGAERAHVFIHGEDIFIVRTVSNLA